MINLTDFIIKQPNIMKNTNLLILVLFMAATVFAQERGAINPETLKKLEQSFDANDPNNKAILNALTENDIKKLAKNRDNIQATDHQFKYKVKVTGISDQKSSGRCWMFTSMNVLRPMVIDKYKLAEFEFSHNYLYFYDILEKSNLFLEAVIKYADKGFDDKYVEWLFKSPVGDGGVWNSFTNLADKYGLVPKSVMPETHTSSNTYQMVKLIKRKLRESGLEIRKMKAEKSNLKNIYLKKNEMLSDIYRILVLNLGVPPKNFKYRFVNKDGNIGELKEYTPKSFMNEVLPEINFQDHIMLMNDPTRPYYKLYEIDYDRNVMEGKNWKYINLPNEELKQYALASIKDNSAMYASCDVGKQLDKDAGILDVDNYDYESLLGVKFGMDKAERIQSFESGSSHGMALVAVDTDENDKTTMWQFENSWGTKSGHKGYLTFTDKWFDEYMFRVVIHKKYLPEKVLKILNTKATLLPPWDPMFMSDF